MPMKKKTNTGLIIGLVVGGVLLCCVGPIAALVIGGLFVVKSTSPLITCSFAFRDARDAVRQYARDHDGKLPAADHWQDEVRPYYEKIVASQPKGQNPFGNMSSGGEWGCENGSGGRTGMAFNDDVSSMTIDKVESSDAIVLFEVQQATANAHEKYTQHSEAGGPKIFGQPRGWFLIRMSSDPVLAAKGKETPVSSGPRVRGD